MISCPFCGHENIEGLDLCDACEQPLTEEYLHEPATAVERGLLNDPIRVLEPEPPVLVSPSTPVKDVLKLLVKKRASCVIVIEHGAMTGIFSERDALHKLGPEAGAQGHRPVSGFMTPGVESLDENAKIAFAVQRMDLGRYRHVPIVDEAGKPTGVISAGDILRYLTEKMTSEV